MVMSMVTELAAALVSLGGLGVADALELAEAEAGVRGRAGDRRRRGRCGLGALVQPAGRVRQQSAGHEPAHTSPRRRTPLARASRRRRGRCPCRSNVTGSDKFQCAEGTGMPQRLTALEVSLLAWTPRTRRATSARGHLRPGQRELRLRAADRADPGPHRVRARDTGSGFVGARPGGRSGLGRRRGLRLTFHVRRSARPPRPRNSWEFVGRILARRLDRSRPLWEVYLVEGLADHQFALVSKTHPAGRRDRHRGHRPGAPGHPPEAASAATGRRRGLATGTGTVGGGPAARGGLGERPGPGARGGQPARGADRRARHGRGRRRGGRRDRGALCELAGDALRGPRLAVAARRPGVGAAALRHGVPGWPTFARSGPSIRTRSTTWSWRWSPGDCGTGC